MKRIFIAIIVFCLAGCAGTQSREMLGMMGASSYQNEPAEFRGIKWGQDIKELKGLQLAADGGESYSVYTRPTDSLLLGDAALKTIEYLFWRDRFLAVRMAGSTDQLQALKNVLTIKFGDGYQPSPYFQDYSWSGPVASIKLLRIHFAADCIITITSREINDLMIIDQGQKAKAGAERGARQDF